MRPSCTLCARKHIGQAIVLLGESLQGYPHHFWVGLGHLAEASDELVMEYPDAARQVRELRKKLEELGHASSDLASSIMGLFEVLNRATPLVAAIPASTAQPAKRGLTLVAGGKPASEVIQDFKKDIQQSKVQQAKSGPTYHEIQREPNPDPKPEPKPELRPELRPEKKCLPCDREKYRKLSLARVPIPAGVRRLVIFTTLSDFSASYSLSTCVLEQAHAALMVGFRVHIIMMEYTQDNVINGVFPDGITVERLVPAIPWKEDAPQDKETELISAAIRPVMEAYAPCSVITHDLLFQSWFVSAAQMLHNIGDSIPGVDWHHMAHSSVTSRPDDPKVAGLRATLPKGHKLLTLNYTDRIYFQSYYRAQFDQVSTLLNGRDVRPWQRMPANAVHIITKMGLHLVDVAQVYPVSATRLHFKGIQHVINLFAAIKSLGKSVRLLIAAAHADGKEGIQQLRDARAFGTTAGLTEDELVFTSDILPQLAGKGLDQDEIRSLFQVTNVFAFPTISEAGSLVLMEAALSDCLLVLNSSLACMADYIPPTAALWVPWGAVKQAGSPVDPIEVAKLVLDAIVGDRRMEAKRHVLREHCVEALGARLRATLLGLDEREDEVP